MNNSYPDGNGLFQVDCDPTIEVIEWFDEYGYHISTHFNTYFEPK